MNMYIANLSENANCTDFWDQFSHVGIVRQVEIVRAGSEKEGKDFVVIDIDAFPQMKWKESFSQQLAIYKAHHV